MSSQSMAGVTKYLIWLIFLMCSPCSDCSPIKRSTNIQDADCYGTECYYDDVDTSTEIVLPENLTEVVLMNLPLISHSQGKIVNILERLSTQTDNQDQMVSLLSNQTVTLDLIATLLNNITGSLNTMLTKHDHMENMVDHQQESLSTLVLLNGGLKLKDCADIALHSYLTKPYMITPPWASKSYNVRCDFETAGGRWTVIQRRLDGSVDFYRFWQDYVDGFGDPYGEYWAGLEFIHLLTETGTWELRVDLEDFDGNTAYAYYTSFRVGDTTSNYRLSLGTYSGTAGNGMSPDNNKQFSTRDNENDGHSTNHCAEDKKGAWWYSACSYANLNGEYLRPNQTNGEGLNWYPWKNTHEVLKKSEMKISRTLSDCTDVATYSSESKPYRITPYGASRFYIIHCDLETRVGWTVIQRRLDGTVNFYRYWQDYVDGFGYLYGEYWAGLELIHVLTKTGTWELRVDLKDFDGNTAYAHYTSFRVGDAASMYRLSYGTYSGTAGNGMMHDNGDQFSTRDNDNDGSGSHCAERHKGGWWYSNCSSANLNGKYLGPNQNNEEGLTWWTWTDTHKVLKKSEMKIRRI